MMRYKLMRWLRGIHDLIGRKENPEHFLFTLDKPLTPEEIWERLWPHGWGFNALSHTYRGQVYTVRKLVAPRYQYHLRFYANGDVTGHFEVDHGAFPLEHHDSVELRGLSEEEKADIGYLLTITQIE